MSCTHASPDPLGRFNNCALNLYGGKPSFGICAQCPSYSGPSRGLGDTVKKVFQATGIATVAKAIMGDDCGCPQRQAKLNNLLPYGPHSSGPAENSGSK